jgi:transcriptional regulator with XRE-family HTH domain
MPKRIPSAIQRAELCKLLIAIRKEAGLDQAAIAKAVGKGQSFVSRYESGDRRLDILELRAVCTACAVTLANFVKRLESQL